MRSLPLVAALAVTGALAARPAFAQGGTPDGIDPSTGRPVQPKAPQPAAPPAAPRPEPAPAPEPPPQPAPAPPSPSTPPTPPRNPSPAPSPALSPTPVQPGQPPPAPPPTAGPRAGSSAPPEQPAQPRQPAQPSAHPEQPDAAPETDPLTGRPIQPRDSTGQLLILRDETGQPSVPRDETGQVILSPDDEDPKAKLRSDSLLRPEDRGGTLNLNEQEGGERARGVGATNYHLRVNLVAGVNSNVVQTQAVLNGPVTQHPALFTGIDTSIDLLTWTTPTDLQDFHVGVRGQHYLPLDGYGVNDDGTLLGSFGRSFTLSPRTALSLNLGGTLTSTNSALLSDGALFQVDPSNLLRVYTLENARVTLTHELAPRWRVVVGAETWVQATVSQAPIQVSATQTVDHKGWDSIAPAADVTFNRDMSPYDIGSIYFRYQYNYIPFALDYTKNPPAYDGTETTQIGSAELRWTHAWSEAFRSIITGGASMSSAPPLDANQSPTIGPVAAVRLTYQAEAFWASLDGSYAYGSTDPRLGFGPSAGGAFSMQGIPYPRGDWNRFSMVATASGSRAVFLQSDSSFTRLTYLGASAELRWSVSNWLGIVAGYAVHHSDFEGSGAYPALIRHIFFLGLAGFFDDDQALPVPDTFVGAVAPAG